MFHIFSCFVVAPYTIRVGTSEVEVSCIVFQIYFSPHIEYKLPTGLQSWAVDHQLPVTLDIGLICQVYGVEVVAWIGGLCRSSYYFQVNMLISEWQMLVYYSLFESQVKFFFLKRARTWQSWYQIVSKHCILYIT